jgi:hypothetical protein
LNCLLWSELPAVNSFYNTPIFHRHRAIFHCYRTPNVHCNNVSNKGIITLNAKHGIGDTRNELYFILWHCWIASCGNRCVGRVCTVAEDKAGTLRLRASMTRAMGTYLSTQDFVQHTLTIGKSLCYQRCYLCTCVLERCDVVSTRISNLHRFHNFRIRSGIYESDAQ